MKSVDKDNLKAARSALAFNSDTRKLYSINKEEAIRCIDDENLLFGQLYISMDDIINNNLFDHLSIRNKIAIIITKEILAKKEEGLKLDCMLCDNITASKEVLKWMLVTGVKDDGMNNDFDKVLDATAAMLVKIYADATVLPLLVDMIFDRNQRGYFYNDLVWIFFESRNPDYLINIANRFKSKSAKDIKLARRLLKFVPNIGTNRGKKPEELYMNFIKWIKTNRGFLYYTGDSFQQSVNPFQYRIAFEGKYLCKEISCDTGNIIEFIEEEEFELLDAFSELDLRSKILLSDYSYALHKRNKRLWNTWLKYPVGQQLKIVEMGIEKSNGENFRQYNNY